MSEHELLPLEEQLEKRTMKHFAGSLSFSSSYLRLVDMFLQKKKSEKNIHAHNSREKMFEEKEKEEVSLKLTTIVTSIA